MRVFDETTGERPVQQYRLYFLDGAGSIAGPAFEFEASGDATAIRMAEAWREGRVLELWCGHRKVLG